MKPNIQHRRSCPVCYAALVPPMQSPPSAAFTLPWCKSCAAFVHGDKLISHEEAEEVGVFHAPADWHECSQCKKKFPPLVAQENAVLGRGQGRGTKYRRLCDDCYESRATSEGRQGAGARDAAERYIDSGEIGRDEE